MSWIFSAGRSGADSDLKAQDRDRWRRRRRRHRSHPNQISTIVGDICPTIFSATESRCPFRPPSTPSKTVLTALIDPDDDGNPQFELKYHNFSSWMHKDRKLPMLTAVNIDGTVAKGVKRENDRWFTDDRIEKSAQIDNRLYKGNALDRGHLVRRLDPSWGDLALEAVVDTFHYTNCAPQHKGLNRKEWLALEDHILESSKTHGFKACVFTGPIFDDEDPDYRETKLPQAFWKIVVTLHAPEAEGEEPGQASSAYVLSQEEMLVDLEFAFGQFRTFQVPISRVRRWANLHIDQAILDADAMLDADEEGLRATDRSGRWKTSPCRRRFHSPSPFTMEFAEVVASAQVRTALPGPLGAILFDDVRSIAACGWSGIGLDRLDAARRPVSQTASSRPSGDSVGTARNIRRVYSPRAS